MTLVNLVYKIKKSEFSLIDNVKDFFLILQLKVNAKKWFGPINLSATVNESVFICFVDQLEIILFKEEKIKLITTMQLVSFYYSC